jgi:phage terminase large subunit
MPKGVQNIKVPAKFKYLYQKKRYKIYYGGRGGAKSWAFAIVLLLKGVQKPIRVLCCREMQHSIKESVHKLLATQIERLGLSTRYKIQRDRIIGVNGTEFVFFGLRHDPQQIKSFEGADYAWVEEAQKVTADSWDFLIPTIRKEGSEIWVSFNPDLETDPTYSRFVLNRRPDSFVVKVSHKDNPFFSKEMLSDMQYDKEQDYQKYLNVWEGECAKTTEAQIFKDKFTISDFETPVKQETFYFGMDWGFSADPTALVRCWIRGNELFIDYEDGGVGIELDHTHKIIDSIPGAKKYTIRADNSRPESISFISRQGYNIVAAPKWSGSVADGIEFIRSFSHIHIHTRCPQTASEFVHYSYKVDRLSGDILPIVLDKWNHYIDALRYALAPIIKFKDLTMKTTKTIGH